MFRKTQTYCTIFLDALQQLTGMVRTVISRLDDLVPVTGSESNQSWKLPLATPEEFNALEEHLQNAENHMAFVCIYHIDNFFFSAGEIG